MITLEEFEEAYAGEFAPWQTHQWKVEAFPLINGKRIPIALAESVGLPFPQFTERNKNVGSTEIFYAGGSNVGSFSITFGLDQRWRALRYIADWHEIIQNPYTGGFRMPSQYKKDIQVGLYDGQGKRFALATARNCWPLGADGPQLDSTPALGQTSAQFKCDGFYINWED